MSGTDGLNGKGEGWIEWVGGECPVQAGAGFDAKTREGREYFNQRLAWWDHKGLDTDIIAYRVHKESAN